MLESMASDWLKICLIQMTGWCIMIIDDGSILIKLCPQWLSKGKGCSYVCCFMGTSVLLFFALSILLYSFIISITSRKLDSPTWKCLILSPAFLIFPLLPLNVNFFFTSHCIKNPVMTAKIHQSKFNWQSIFIKLPLFVILQGVSNDWNKCTSSSAFHKIFKNYKETQWFEQSRGENFLKSC